MPYELKREPLCVFRLVGGGAASPARCPPRSLCGFPSSRSGVIQTIPSQSPPCFSYPALPFFMPAFGFCARSSKDVLWNDLLPQPGITEHPRCCCVTLARLAKFKKTKDFLCFFFFPLSVRNRRVCDCVCQWGERVYMCAHVWRCNHSSVWVDCRPVSGGRGNNRRNRNLFRRFTDHSLLDPSPRCFWISSRSDVCRRCRCLSGLLGTVTLVRSCCSKLLFCELNNQSCI